MSSLRLKIGLAVLDIALVVSACTAGYVRYKEYRHARDYSIVLGQITTSELSTQERYSKGRWHTSHTALITYEYVVDDHRYWGSQIRWPLLIQSNTDARELVRRYPRGKIVSVHYDPLNPEKALLDLSHSNEMLYLTFILLAVHLAIGIGKSIINA
ncbi:MAG: DUF3592 domain-containing protein [Myxococcales bacterium]|jgi:hypothetical protein|nr:DUF3592 domain-containing protein [Myxococcales bacterium]